MPVNESYIRKQMFRHLEERSIFNKARDFAFEYMDTVKDRNVFPDEKALEGLSAFDEPLSESYCDPGEILRLLHEKGSPATTAQTGGRYFGFVNGGAVPASLACRWLSDVWDQNAVLYVASPIVSKLESVCQNWLNELFGLPEGSVMGLVSGTSTATMCGLAAGRNALLMKQNWDVNEKGLYGAPQIRVITGEHAHSTVYKALALLGMGKACITFAPVDKNGAVDPDQLPQMDDQTLLILQAGNVNSGAFDPFEEIIDKAKQKGAWVHIDGAFGLWAQASKHRKDLTKGMEKADSWSVDAHKTLNVPYDCGIVLCRDEKNLINAMQASGSYIIYSEERDPMLYVPEMSRRNRAVELWAALKFMGKNGVADLVDGLCDLAVYAAREFSEKGFRVLNDVVFNQVMIACDTPEETAAVLAAVQASGHIWCGGSSWEGEPVVRISVCSWATTKEDMDKAVAAFIEAREKIRST